mgnify:CR=1 FL=1
MYTRGLVVGKFYPPHRGHKYLIDTAIAECKEVTVIVCAKMHETISGELRASWIERIHPSVHVILIKEPMPGDNESEEWAKFTIKLLGYVPDAVFTSEEYGDPYARFMKTIHVCVDKARVRVPISGTKVRANPSIAAEFLEPCVRAYFAKRIVVLGAESTGTTTLAKTLAEHYKTVWVPEYGRLYSEGRLQSGEKWKSEEFVTIARAQAELEDALAEQSNGIVICDTDPFATGIWHERYMGSRSLNVERVSTYRKYDLYIVTSDEIPFEQDGTRDGEHIRHDMHKLFIKRLEETGRKYVLVTGTREERLAQAVAAISAL